MGEGAAGVVCEFVEERLRFSFSEGSHFWQWEVGAFNSDSVVVM